MKKLTIFITAIWSISILATGSLAYADKAIPQIITKSKSVKVAAVETETKQETPPEPKIITVQPGDFLEKLATENETTSLRLFYANTEIVNPDLIYPDQKLRVPTAEEELTPREVPINQQVAVPTAAEGAQAAAAAPRRTASATNYAVGDGSVWDQLAACESGGNWAINTGNGYYGGLQFTLSTWQSLGGSGLPSNASREEQIARAQALQARSGWGQWPACTAKLGLR
jgi:LysM repeat protein